MHTIPLHDKGWAVLNPDDLANNYNNIARASAPWFEHFAAFFNVRTIRIHDFRRCPETSVLVLDVVWHWDSGQPD